MKRYCRRIISSAALMFIAILVIAAGTASAEKIQPGKIADPSPTTQRPPAHTATVKVRTQTEWYEAVGTVRPRTESKIEAQVTAQVRDVRVRPGASVAGGALLVTLDDRQYRSRLDQAREGLKTAQAGRRQAEQAVAAAQAAFTQAEAAFGRTRKYLEAQAATAQDMEQAEAAYHQAEAGLKRSQEALSGSAAGIRQAEEVVREAEIALGYTRIRAPEAGTLLRRMVEPGDMALPGKPLLVLQTAGTHRMEAHVREGLISAAAPGSRLPVIIGTLDQTAEAVVEEVVPYADPATRTFLVKAGLPPLPGLYPGMFGKLRVPVRKTRVVVIPERALRRVGQLELVRVQTDGRWADRFVKTGKPVGDDLEVLSGLSGGETIGYE
jgi:RND family efflux transporter MFP subunit